MRSHRIAAPDGPVGRSFDRAAPRPDPTPRPPPRGTRAAAYARHGQELGGESPLGIEVVRNPQPEARASPRGGVGRKPEANARTEEHEPHEARRPGRACAARRSPRPPRGHRVDAAASGGKRLLLSGEACRGSGSPDRGRRKVATDPAGVSSGHSTGGDRQRREGPNVSPGGEPGRLAIDASSAATPRGAWAGRGGERVKPADTPPERSADPASPDPTVHPARVEELWESFLSRANLARALRRVKPIAAPRVPTASPWPSCGRG